MDKLELYRSIGEVDETLLERTEEKRNYRPIRIWAASLALVIGLAGLSWVFWPDGTAADATPWFAITVHAANGEKTALNLNEGCQNAAGTGENIFGVDMPLFCFELNPTRWQEQEASYSEFELLVDYLIDYDNNEVWEPVWENDAHVRVMEQTAVINGVSKPIYGITGWFEEPTDLMISVAEKKSHRLVERIVLRVCYDDQNQVYALTVTESKTYFDEYILIGRAPQRPEYPLTQQQLNAPTAELVDYIMGYPYLAELLLSSTLNNEQHSYDTLRVAYHYNGFLELETRPDAASALLEEYADVVLNPTADNALDDNILWTLLSVSPYKQMLTPEETVRFEALRDIKRQQDEAQLEKEAANGN